MKNAEKMKKQVNKGLSDLQKDFANAIDYEALEKAMNNKDFLKVLKKIKL